MKRILVPIDGSATANRVVIHLINKLQEQDPSKMEIHLLNVQRPFSGGVTMFVNQEETNQYHHDRGWEAMREARELLDKAGIAYIAHICVGDPADVIARNAKEKKCDEIIMGTHGRGELLGMLLG